MPVGAIIGATTIGGAAIASNSANRQTQAATNTANQNNALQQQIFNTQRADLAPWRESGTRALAEINRRLGLTPATAPATPQTTPVTPGNRTPSPRTGNTLTRLQDRLDPQGIRMVQDEAPTSPDGPVTPVGPTGPTTLPPTNPLAPGGVPKSLLAVDGTGPQINPGNGTTMPAPPSGTMTGSTPATDPEGRYDNFYASPGYQFRFDEGQRGINANRAASGMLQSGDTLRALTRYGQDYASNEYNTQLNQLMSVAGLGQTATGQGNALASNYANQVGMNNQNASNALQSSYGTQANAWGNALGQLGGYAAYRWG